ncbi:von Willebrand factor type A domain-containing protein [Zhongshania sp.]|uniref:vWA domain-containing protein n=1 Tax=Zhongshania sp. TaxID=1971902 RepID=UPI00356AFD10
MKYAASLSLLFIFAIAFIFLRGPQDSLLENQGTSKTQAPHEFEHHGINELAEPQRNAVKDEAYTSAISLPAPKPASEKMLAEHFAGAQAAAAHAKQIKESAMLVRQRSHFIADTDSPMSIAPRDREGYAAKTESRFLSVALSPLSTFGLEVDSASYANMRRQINNGQIPVPASVRLEELVNYFDYNFPAPTGKHPIAVMSDYAVAPWNPAHRIAMIGVKAVDTTASSERGARITFLLDTSASMNSPNKLPLLIRSFQTLLSNLKQDDQVAIVTYAGSAGVVLPPTPVTESHRIQRALANLSAGGSTAGGAGIALAYDVARKQFDSKSTNLVILATDGDFNVGASSDGELKAMIEKQRASGVFLSVIGMGTGNYQDAKMQVLAEAGNGVAHYLDSDAEAQRLFGAELSRTLHIAAKDVKVQVEFNPAAVAEYRLLGYESRVMNAEDFRDDKKDSGEIGAGHSVVALYEIIPTGNGAAPDIERRYPTVRSKGSQAMELGFVKIRYKQPDGDNGIEFAHAMTTRAKATESATPDLRWASAVAEFSLVLSQSEHAGSASYAAALRRARAVLPLMPDDKRSEFIGLIERLTTTRIAQE